VKPRFQADNDLRGSIRTGVLRREPSIDFRSAHAAKLDGLRDPEVLRLATAEGRILVSHDENSMLGHFGDFLASGSRSPGVLIVPQGTPVSRVGSLRTRMSGLTKSSGCLSSRPFHCFGMIQYRRAPTDGRRSRACGVKPSVSRRNKSRMTVPESAK
jgi:hypothetical protein